MIHKVDTLRRPGSLIKNYFYKVKLGLFYEMIIYYNLNFVENELVNISFFHIFIQLQSTR